MIPIEQRLWEMGDFLYLSRRQADCFAQPLSFTLENATQVHITAPGIIAFEPPGAGHKDIILSCGVHGNETAPIEICDDFVRQILTGELVLAHRVMFQFGNLPAMDIAERFVEENMNRLFSGAHSEGEGLVNEERKRAKVLEEATSAFFGGMPVEGRERIHYDLHTAIRASKNEKFAVYPFLHGKAHNKAQLAFLRDCGVKTILLSESSTTTYSYYSSHQHQAHAFTVELGKVRPFGENDMRRFADARLMLQKLISQAELELEPFVPEQFLIYRVNQVINRQHHDFTLTFPEDEPNFTDYPRGHVLANDGLHQYKTEFDGEAIVFPNANVAIGQRALLTVVPAAITE